MITNILLILFIPLLTQSYDYFSGDIDPCYDSEGGAITCQPDFVNAAFNREVLSSSLCGSPPSKHCFWHAQENLEAAPHSSRILHQPFLHRRYRQQPQHHQHPHNQMRSTCYLCDSTNSSTSHPPSFLTDLHNSNNPTCWSSSLLSKAPSDASNSTHLTIPLGRTFQITYISLQFCHTRPDSMAIYKSSDFGKSWTPYQFYSSQCKRMYKRAARKEADEADEQQALCSEEHSLRGAQEVTAKNFRIDFSTLEGRPSASDFDSNEALQEWQTATDIRIIFNRILPVIIPTSFPQSNNHFKHRQLRSSPPRRRFAVKKVFHQRRASKPFKPPNPHDSFLFYSLSDLAVGGRCKCNGHASSCFPEGGLGGEGLLKCQCRHNTEGDDCERCKSFFVDRPWNRATNQDANECVSCDCNGHSNKCTLDMKAFKESGLTSGGVCQNCKHKTEGRKCQLCREGYYRNPRKPISHKEACIACKCHPIGSLGTSCDHETGECRCRTGVIGQSCNRCAPAFHQSRSTLEPCVRTEQNPTASQSTANEETSKHEQGCRSCLKRVSIRSVKNICEKENVMVAEVLSSEALGAWIRYNLRTIRVVKQASRPKNKRHFTPRRPRASLHNHHNPPLRRFTSQHSFQLPRRTSSSEVLWIPKKSRADQCHCQKLKTGLTYLVMGDTTGEGRRRTRTRRKGVVMDRGVLAVRLDETGAKRLKRKLKRAVNSDIC